MEQKINMVNQLKPINWRTSKKGKYMFNIYNKHDTRIQKIVMQELRNNPQVTSSNLKVYSHDGNVTLCGQVPHYFEKSVAEEIAEKVQGVKSVTDKIEVNVMKSYEISDERMWHNLF